MVCRLFNRLGRRLAERWEGLNFDGRVFPDLAIEELLRMKPWDLMPASALVPWAMRERVWPYQVNIEATFGEPPLTLFWHPRFFIEALHWATGTPGVHQHGFSGAFAVWE